MDVETRALERHEPGSPRHLVARLRVGTLERRWVECAALLGDEAARAVTDWPPPWVEALGMGRGEFVVREIDRDLPTLLRALDREEWALVRSVPCEPCEGAGTQEPRTGRVVLCPTCKGSGTRDVPVPLLVRAALAAALEVASGRLCSLGCVRDYDGSRVNHDMDYSECIVRRALDACAAWIAEPTEANRRAWGHYMATSETLPIDAVWVPRVHDIAHPEDLPARMRMAAAGLIGEEAVRDAIREALVPEILRQAEIRRTR